MRNAWIWIVVVVVVIGGGLLWWQNSQQSGASNQVPTVNEPTDFTPPTAALPATVSTTTATTTPVAAVGVMKEISVTNEGFKFSPSTMTVKKGDKVKITYTNGGGTHDFQIEGYNVQTKTIQGGQSDSVEFTADKAGTFEYFCSVGNHRAVGMKGTLTVTP